MTVYIKAERNAVAERAIISGDPSRINQLAEMLEGAKMISDSGGFLVYTGTYKGTPVTVATHGIGGTSASIIINDLISLGVRKIIRLGTAGSLKEDIEVGDVIVATGAHYSPGGALGYNCGKFISAAPDFTLTKKLYQSLKSANIKVHLGTVFSKNAFYTLEDLNPWLISIGVLSLEMECATLMIISRSHKVNSACALIVSDNVVKKSKMYTAAELKNFVSVASHAVMDSIIS